jgi:hypothetical protein
MRGRAGIAGVPSSGHASKGISQEPKRALHPLLITAGEQAIFTLAPCRLERRILPDVARLDFPRFLHGQYLIRFHILDYLQRAVRPANFQVGHHGFP